MRVSPSLYTSQVRTTIKTPLLQDVVDLRFDVEEPVYHANMVTCRIIFLVMDKQTLCSTMTYEFQTISGKPP